MKSWHVNTIIVLVCLNTFRVYPQTTCDPPLPPLFNSVSVQPETGFTEFSWTSSTSPDVAAYLIYSYHNENGIPRGDIIDTIWNPAATGYTYKSSNSMYFSVSYVIAAFRIPKCTSPFSNVINTMFAEASIDTCNKKVLLKWNSYSNIPKKIINYSVLVSVNGSSLAEAGTAAPDKGSFELKDFRFNASYCFVIRANLEGGLVSTSNKVCLSTKMQRPPDWINADYATVNNKELDLSFSVDPLTQISTYRLERKTTDDIDFNLLTRLETTNNKITYTDKTADPLKINYYRLLAINNCNNPIISSNIVSNIVPVLENKENIIKLTWNSYRLWQGRVSSYTIYVDKGNGFSEISSLSSSDTVFTINYANLMYDITGSSLCFYILASETGNPHGIDGKAASVAACTDLIENIFIPTAFTPNNDLINDYFRPVLSFTPAVYHLLITDRRNTIVFESRNHLAEWDGKKNGQSLPQGIYLWYLEVRTYSGKQLTRTGTVTILN